MLSQRSNVSEIYQTRIALTMGLRPLQISYSSGPATEIHSGKGARPWQIVELNRVYYPPIKQPPVHQELGHGLTLKNSLRHFAHPFPGALQGWVKSTKFGLNFSTLGSRITRSGIETKQNTWWNLKPSLGAPMWAYVFPNCSVYLSPVENRSRKTVSEICWIINNSVALPKLDTLVYCGPRRPQSNWNPLTLKSNMAVGAQILNGQIAIIRSGIVRLLWNLVSECIIRRGRWVMVEFVGWCITGLVIREQNNCRDVWRPQAQLPLGYG